MAADSIEEGDTMDGLRLIVEGPFDVTTAIRKIAQELIALQEAQAAQVQAQAPKAATPKAAPKATPRKRKATKPDA